MHAARSRAVISPYNLLGVTAGSNSEEVRAAYKRKALETHPDKGGDPAEFLRVKQAYEAITSGKATPPGAPPGRPPSAPPARPPPCRPSHVKPDLAAPRPGVSLAERLARKRPPQCMEDELLSGFAAVQTPGGPTARRVAERMAAGGVAQERQSASLSARVSAQATAKKIKAPAAEQVSVVKLWEKLTKLSAKDRTTAISNLDASLREKLSKYLATRKTGRVEEPPASSAAARPSPSPSPPPETSKKLQTQAGSDSDSSSSDSSGSSGSSHENSQKVSGRRGGVIGQKPAHRALGKGPGDDEVG